MEIINLAINPIIAPRATHKEKGVFVSNPIIVRPMERTAKTFTINTRIHCRVCSKIRGRGVEHDSTAMHKDTILTEIIIKRLVALNTITRTLEEV